MSREDTLKNSQAKKDKLPLAEVHPMFEVLLAKAFKIGKEKGYEPYSWLDTEMFTTQDMINAARRHINAHLSGELHNVEPGCETVTLHLVHSAFSLLIAATQIELKEQKDDNG